MPTHPALALAGLTLLSLLACAGGTPPLSADASPPAWPAEPVALVDLPDEERPTGLALLPDGGFVATVQALGRSEEGRALSYGGVRFRRADGAPGNHPDLPLELDVSADAVALSRADATAAVARYDRIDLATPDGGAHRTLSLNDPDDGSAERLLSKCSSPWQLLWAGPRIVARCAIGPPVVLVDVETGARSIVMPKPDIGGPFVTVTDIAVSADGRTLAVAGTSDDFTKPATPWVELRSLPDGTLVRQIPLGKRYEDVAFSPDGARLAVSHPYFGLQILDAADGRVLAEHTYEPDDGDRGSGDVVWAPDGKRLYRVGRRLGVSVHDAVDARVLGFLPAHPDEPENPMPPPSDWPATLSSRNGTLALTPDGRFLASIERSDFGRAVRVWRLPGE